ncbi:hypothetical protein BH18THE2_BH18THE2_23470 [soil metagenome]
MVWVMILVVCAFLIVFVAPIQFVFLEEPYDRLLISLIQAFMAIVAVVVLVFALSKLKKLFIQKQLKLK